MKRILFICLGNICRSPMAEAVMKHLVAEQGTSAQWHIDSAGTSNWHEGERPHKGTLAKLAQYDISTDNMYSRPLVREDADRFDVFVCMDTQNVEDARRILGPNVPITTLLPNRDVPDPYYTGDFQETYNLCILGCKQILTNYL